MTASWIVVGGGIALLLLMVLVLVRQGSPTSLSDEDGKTPQRERFVIDRPAGPDAEGMSSDAALGPSNDPSVATDISRPASAAPIQEPGADGSTH
jgi:hypothetical protein